MNLRQKAVNGVVWSVIQKWGREAISFLILVALARLLEPEAFGLVALATVFTTFVQVFLDQGFSAAIVQRAEVEREHLDTAFWISLLIGFFLTTISIAAAGLVAGFFDEPDLTPILRWLSISFIFGALSSTQMAILQRNLGFKSLATRSMTAKLGGGIVAVILAFAGFGVWSLVAQKLVAGVVGIMVLWRASDWRPGFNLSKRHFKELFSFGISITGNKIMLYFNRRSDDFLIGYFLGTTLLGYYTIGHRMLLVIIRVVTGITNAVAFPTFSRLQENPKRMRRAYYKVTQFTSLLAFPVFIGLAVLASELIPAIFGDEWAPSIPVMQILALMGILQSVIVFNGSIIKARGKPSWQFAILLLTSLCGVIGFLLVVQWGIVAVAAVFVIVGYLLAPISYFATHRLMKIDFKSYFKQFVAPLTASLAMLIVILGLKVFFGDQDLHLYIKLAIYITAGALTYLVVILLIAPSLSRQVLEIVNLAIPDWKLKMNRYIHLRGEH